MLQFRTLGTIDLRADAGERIESVLLHSKRLSLLAYLSSASPPRLHRRDTLVALFWPELDDAHARGALRHELYELRRSLGSGVLLGERGEALGIDPQRLWCDACAFETAAEAGRLAEALRLWGGSFLRGRQATSPLGVRLAPSPNRPATRGQDPVTPQPDLEERRGQEQGRGPTHPVVRRRGRPSLRYLRWLLPVTILLAAATIGLMMRLARRPDDVHPSPVMVNLLPTENRTEDRALDALARRLTDRLAAGLQELAFIRLVIGPDVAPVAAVVSAVVSPHGELVEARTRLAEPGAGGHILALPEPIVLHPDSPDASLDTLVARVLAAVAAQYDPRTGIPLVGGAPFRTPSWDAYLEYIRGAEFFGALDFARGATHLRRAYEIDPHFVKAAVFAAIALAYAGDPSAADSLVTRAMADDAQLNDYERFFGTYFLADLHGRRPDAYRATMELERVTAYPTVRMLAGREAMRMNRPRESVRMLTGWDVGFGWWRNWTEYWELTAGAYHVIGNHRAELAFVRASRARFPESLELARAEVRALAAVGDSSRVLRVLDEALTLPPARAHALPPGLITPADVAWTAAQELEAHGSASAADSARRIARQWLGGYHHPSRADSLMEVRLLLESGDPERASAALAWLAPFHDLESLGLVGLVAAALGDSATAVGVAGQLEGLALPYLSGRHLLLAAGINAALQRTDLAMQLFERALAAGLPFGVELHALPMLRPLEGRRDFEAVLRPRG